MPRLFSYIVDHDTGYAPNPSNDICTLAYCKYPMRPHVKEGDYVVGLGKKELGNHLVYAMRVTEALEHDLYLLDPRFAGQAGRLRQRQRERGNRQVPHGADQHGLRLLGRRGPASSRQPDRLIIDRQGYKGPKNTPLIPAFIEWFEGVEKGCLGEPTGGDKRECC